MKKSIKVLGEFGFIEDIRKRIKKSRDVLIGIGDDCAVLKTRNSSEVELLTVDSVVEGIHFVKGTDEVLVGRKALARSLSDIAAMGGVPKYAILAMGISSQTKISTAHRFLDGFLKMADDYKVHLVGGDVSRSPHFFASVTVVGYAKRGRALLRRGARAGDYIYVSGSLGGSILGKHLKFIPRIKEGKWLAESGIPTAMIDVSDGLLGDLRHVIEESRVGAQLVEKAIPVSKSARFLSLRDGRSPLIHALKDGEDYELLFTTGRKDLAWRRKFQERFGVSVSCIGRIIHEPFKIYIEDENGMVREIKEKSFTHF